jgi:hypothetical protein
MGLGARSNKTQEKYQIFVMCVFFFSSKEKLTKFHKAFSPFIEFSVFIGNNGFFSLNFWCFLLWGNQTKLER